MTRFEYFTPDFIGDVLVPLTGETFDLDGVRWMATAPWDRDTRTVALVDPDGIGRWWPVTGIWRARVD